MRTQLSGYEMSSVSTLTEALQLLSAEPGWTPFAGGTDLMVLMEAGRLPAKRYLSIRNIRELRGVQVTGDVVTLGALATYTDLLSSDVIGREFPLVASAARETGAVAIQNRGTVAGNIANASPAADLPPALLVYDATLRIASNTGERSVPYADFHKGYKVMDLRPGELITAVTLGRGRHWSHQTYRKVGTRRTQAIAKVCFAATAQITGATVDDIRIGLGSVAPTVVRCRRTEDTLRGQQLDAQAIARATALLQEDIAPIDDIRSNERYRRLVAGNLLEQFLTGVTE